MKKAQGISINTIIIAAIALIVLIILIAVFTGRISLWGGGLDDSQKGVSCTTDYSGKWKSECATDEKIATAKFSDQEQGLFCCYDPTIKTNTDTDPTP